MRLPTGSVKSGRLFVSEHFGVTPDTTVLGKSTAPIVAVIADPALDVAPDLPLGDYTHKETVGILLTLPLSLVPALTLMPLIGLALNGTSSALYGTVAEFVTPERRARAFGLFYALWKFCRRDFSTDLRCHQRRRSGSGRACDGGHAGAHHDPTRPPPSPVSVSAATSSK